MLLEFTEGYSFWRRPLWAKQNFLENQIIGRWQETDMLWLQVKQKERKQRVVMIARIGPQETAGCFFHKGLGQYNKARVKGKKVVSVLVTHA